MSLSTSRSRRSNAGSRMSSLIDSNDMRDETYDNIYGGFNDEEEDDSYSSESSETDNVDSDFSIDESDEPISDDTNEDQFNDKRSKTKFDYNRKKNASKETIIAKTDPQNHSFDEEMKVSVVVEIPDIEPIISRRSLRSTETESERCYEKKFRNKDKNKKRIEVKLLKKISAKELSQQEMLAEAVITEKVNSDSLKEYQKLELEKAKKSKVVKHSIKGPFIRYHSVSMPIIEEVVEDNHNDIHNHQKDLSINSENNIKAKTHSRTFISFSDEQNYESLLNTLKSASLEVPKVTICPVTQLPARYIDPVSQLPYATSEAFSAIRNQYLKQLEIHGNTNQPEVAQWMGWRQQNQEKWDQWQQKHCSYDSIKLVQNEIDAQSVQSQSLVYKVNSIPEVIQSSRKRRKSKK